MMARKGPDQIDKIVGQHIKIRRVAEGLSQTELADKLGLTFQQVQKYEKGTNRVGAGRLFRIAEILKVPVTAFFEGSETAHRESKRPSPLSMLADSRSFRLVQAFSTIRQDNLRRSVVELVETIAAKSR